MNWKGRLLENAVIKLAQILSRIIPKKRDYFIFIPTHDTKNILSGNSLALLRYIRKNHSKIKCELVIFKKKNIVLAEDEQSLVIRRNILSIYWSVLRAKHIIQDGIVYDPFVVNGHYSIIQLWHGTGFKNIGLLADAKIPEENLQSIKKQFSKIKFIVSTSESDACRKNESYDVKKAIVTGSPRNDVFFEDSTYLQKLKVQYKVNSYKRVISYAPTFREAVTKEPFSSIFWEKLNDHLKEHNEIFLVKKHSWDKYLTVPEGLSNIKDYSQVIKDAQELLLITDLLISDYSGILTDFVITDRPVILYMYDFDLYMKHCRTMYYNLEEILPKPFVYQEKDLLEKIINSKWLEDKEYQESYKAFKHQFHKYLDGNSSNRVLEQIYK